MVSIQPRSALHQHWQVTAVGREDKPSREAMPRAPAPSHLPGTAHGLADVLRSDSGPCSFPALPPHCHVHPQEVTCALRTSRCADVEHGLMVLSQQDPKTQVPFTGQVLDVSSNDGAGYGGRGAGLSPTTAPPAAVALLSLAGWKMWPLLPACPSGGRE